MKNATSRHPPSSGNRHHAKVFARHHPDGAGTVPDLVEHGFGLRPDACTPTTPPRASPVHPAVWRADQLQHGRISVQPSRYPDLDAELPGGGWPIGMVTELIARDPGIGELRLLIPLLRQLTLERRIVIMLAPPLIPYAPALAGFGVDLDYLIIVQATNAADRLWAVEQTLKSSSFGALLAWLPQSRTRPEHLRRMQLAAQSSQGPVFLFRQFQAQFESSPAPLRLLLLPRPGQTLSVQILKRRGPLLAHSVQLSLPMPLTALPVRPVVPSIAQAPAPSRPAQWHPHPGQPHPHDLHVEHTGQPWQGGPDATTLATQDPGTFAAVHAARHPRRRH